MIKARASFEDGHYKFTADGHAGYSQSNDIVCAAVSALVVTFISFLESLESENGNFRCVSKGHAEAHFGEDGKTALDILLIGLGLIEKEYPEYLSVVAYQRDCRI